MSLASENEARELFLSGGDLRQLFARDTGQDDAAPLVYLPDGDAPRFRDACDAGQLVCPYPGCAQPRYSAVGRPNGRVRHHFRHRNDGAGGHAKETYFHVVGKQLLADWARTAIPGTTTALEVALPEIDRRADALATTPDGRRFALEVQYAGLDFSEWAQRDNDYRSIDITPIWVFGHLRPHLVPGRGYVVAGELKVTALFEQIIEASRGPIHLVNPDTQQIAQLLPVDDARAIRALDDQTPVPYGISNAVLGVAPLSDCTLTATGMRSPWADRLDAGRRRLLQQAAEERAREQARQEQEQRAAAARKAADDRRAANEAARAKRVREQLAAEKTRAVGAATAARGRVQHADHEAIAPGGPQLAGVPSDAWRLLIYLETIHDRVGQNVRAFDIYGRARRVLPSADRQARASTITDWIFELRALRLLDFASLGRAIVGPIRVIGDVDHPAPADEVQRRRAMDVHVEGDEYIAIDRERSALFVISRRGAIVSRRRIDATAPAPAPPPQPQRASDAEWKAARRAERAAHVPAWVTKRLFTDLRVPVAPVDWHGAIWDQHIRGQVGAQKPWNLLMATLVAYGGRRNGHTEDALLGFLAHLQRNRAVKYEASPGRPPDFVVVTSGAATEE